MQLSEADFIKLAKSEGFKSFNEIVMRKQRVSARAPGLAVTAPTTPAIVNDIEQAEREAKLARLRVEKAENETKASLAEYQA